MKTQLEWTQVNNDSNGNPRHVVHFLALGSDYAEVLKKCNKMGGRKFHNRQYGGGIVFECVRPDKKELQLMEVFGIAPKPEPTAPPLPEYYQLPFYRRISAEFAGFTSDGRGPFVKFMDERGTSEGGRLLRKFIMDNEPGEHLEEYALRKIREAGYIVTGRCDRKTGHSFLCDTTNGDFSKLK